MDQVSREETNLDNLMRQIDERADAAAGGSISNPFGAFGDGANETVGRGGMGAEDGGAAPTDQAEREKERLIERTYLPEDLPSHPCSNKG